MPQALLIAGDSKRHLLGLLALRNYLRHEAGVKDVRLIRGAYLDKREFKAVLGPLLSMETDDPLLLAYHGHGGKDGWWFNDENVFNYWQDLGRRLKESPRRVLIINDCCHSRSFLKAFPRDSVLMERIGVVPSVTEDKQSSAGLVPRIIEAWRRREDYDGGVVDEEVSYLHVEISSLGTMSPQLRRRVLHCVSRFLHRLSPPIKSRFVVECEPFDLRDDPPVRPKPTGRKIEIKRRLIPVIPTIVDPRSYDAKSRVIAQCQGTRTVPMRWGVHLDHYFWPTESAPAATPAILRAQPNLFSANARISSVQNIDAMG